jgi:hypothetical protein
VDTGSRKKTRQTKEQSAPRAFVPVAVNKILTRQSRALVRQYIVRMYGGFAAFRAANAAN